MPTTPRSRRQATAAVAVNGEAIRKLRQDRGIEVAHLATRLGISRAYLCKIELGHSPRVGVTVWAGIVRNLRPETPDALRAVAA